MSASDISRHSMMETAEPVCVCVFTSFPGCKKACNKSSSEKVEVQTKV